MFSYTSRVDQTAGNHCYWYRHFHSNRSLTTAWKVSKYGVISGPYFPVFGLNTDIYAVKLRIQSEYRKIRTRNNSVFGHFWRYLLLLEEHIVTRGKKKLTSRITGRITHRKNRDLIRTPVIITQKPHFSHFFMIKLNLIKSMC